MKNGSQHTIVFHVDDVMSSHVDKKVNERFARWLEKKYGQHSPVTIHTGKVHDYLGMIFDYSKKGQVEVDMKSYVKDMIESFPKKVKTTDIALTAASNDLFEESKGKTLDKENDSGIEYKSCKTNRVRMEQVEKIDQIFEWNKKQENDYSSRTAECHQVVCGCSICSASRFQESHRNGDDNGRWSLTSNVEKTKVEHSKQH